MEIASLSYQALAHPTYTSPWIRKSKIGRAPTLRNEYKYGRWEPSVLDGSSHSADPRKKVNNKRIVFMHYVIGQFCRLHSTAWTAMLVSFLFLCPRLTADI